MTLETALKDALITAVGADYLIEDEAERRFMSQDVFEESAHMTKAIAAPASTSELADVVKAAVHAGYAVFPRGGGMSYTSGYLPTTDKAITVDMRRMNKVLTVNTEDMYVTVEAGCTWLDLHTALKGTGLRTPYWGTLSGIHATVGGSMSQNSIFFGSGLYGQAVDSVLGFEVVVADGSVITTGSASHTKSSPFMRHYGPDLTGIFTSDAGALGFKATITLRLITQPKEVRHVSVNFPTLDSMFSAATEVSRRGLASESFGFDPVLHKIRMRRESLAKDIKALGNVMKKSGSIMGAVKQGAKIALAGRGYMDDVVYAYNFTTEQHSAHGADDTIREIEQVARDAGGEIVENTIPTIVRANPFMPLNNMVGPEGERWLPVHGLVPHSKAVVVTNALNAFFAEHAAKIEKYSVDIGYLFATVGSNISVVELVFFWPDSLMDIQKRTVEKSAQKNFKDFGDRTEARAFVAMLRENSKKIYADAGSIHMQIGKGYPYKETLDPVSFAVVQGLKKSLDPKGLMNPGALGL